MNADATSEQASTLAGPLDASARWQATAGMRRWLALASVGAVLALASVLAVAPRSLSSRTRAALVVSCGGPLLALGWWLASRAAERLYGPMRRFWTDFGRGNAAFAVSFFCWGATLLTESRLLGALSVIAAGAAAGFLMAAVISRVRTVEGTGSGTINAATAVVAMTAVCSLYAYSVAPQLMRSRGTAPTLFLGIAAGSTTGVGYLFYVLLRKHREFARRPDQLVTLSILLCFFTVIANALYLLTPGPTENAFVALAVLFAISPAICAPLAESGTFLSPRPMAEQAAPPLWPLAGSWAILVALGIHAVVSFAATSEISLLRTSALVVSSGVLGACSLALVRELAGKAELARAQQAALESLYEHETAKEAALLDILQRVSEGWNLSDIVEGALSAVVESTRAERALFLVLDIARERVQILGSKGLSQEELEELRSVPLDPYPLLREFKGGRSVVRSNTPLPGLSETGCGFGTYAFAAVAISGWEEGGTAELCVDSTRPSTRFTEDDVRMMEAIADYVNLALSRMRLFRELAASEERYRLLVEESADGIVELDAEGRILFSNATFARIMGRKPLQLLGNRISELIPDLAWEPPPRGTISRSTATYKSEAGEVVLEIYQSLRRDGKVLALARDVTERHRYAQHIRHLYEQLAEKEKLRTKALAKLIKTEEDTRSRIAADLHDGPIQELSRLAIALDLTKKHLEQGRPEEALSVLSDIRKSLSAEVLKMRGLMTELRPPVLQERGIVEAIEAYARSFENETGIRTRLDLRPVLCQDKSQELVLYRIFQEAMTNIKKHAFAREVAISLYASPQGEVTLTIADDGVGFDPAILSEAVRSGHIGIASIRERAELAGGSCQIASEPGQGTTVRVTLTTKVENDAGKSPGSR
jgi:PAS domain S-box-containing protein